MTPPRSLYVHAPWCVVKCPYCDFNAYALKSNSPQQEYMTALIADFYRSMRLFPQPLPPPSIYFGGGTPSLMSPKLWADFFRALKTQWPELLASGCEITMEISPLVEQSVLEDLIALGINRFSAGVQSFQEPLLRLLGREHRSTDSYKIAELCRLWPQIRWNIDIIYGLKAQSAEQVQADLAVATQCGITHLSWYELMIEPGTVFARSPELKAPLEQLEELEAAGLELLTDWEQYEVSAYALHGHYSRHNMAYWMAHDYLGIGAGAHSKLTLKPYKQYRCYKTRSPKDYIRSQRFITDNTADLTTDFLISRLRLFRPIAREELRFFPHRDRMMLLSWFESQKDNPLWARVGPESFELSMRGRLLISDLLQDWLSYRQQLGASK